jgi:transcriptional regulator with XRE-family HTH domain
MKNLLGDMIQRRRMEMGMTQRQLAKAVGVKPSHIGYLEHGRRRPSLSLVTRLANILGLEKRKLFFSAHPEAQQFIDQPARPEKRSGKQRAWDQLVKNKALMRRHRINPAELKVLSQINLLGNVSSTRDYLFVLHAIRQALEEEWPQRGG